MKSRSEDTWWETAIGAPDQPRDDVRVLLEPVGHPLCPRREAE